jgi:hypothetical protein
MQQASSMLRAAPLVAPEVGFVERFEARLAYQAEQRRRTMIWMLLGLGAMVLALLALPSVFDVLRLTGHVVLPYRVTAYATAVLDWLYLLTSALLEAVGTLARSVCSGANTGACVLLAAVPAALIVLWTRLVIGRLAGQRAR